MKISLVQFISDKKKEGSLKRAEWFIKKESRKSNLIVFPEQFLGEQLDEEESRTIVSKFQALAKKYKIDIVPGSFLAKRGKATFNTSYYIDARGKILARYDKTNPWKSEKISKGKGPKTFKTRFGKTALIICWDLSSPYIASKLKQVNPDLIICPSMWWEGSEIRLDKKFAGDFIDSLCMTRAYECKAAIAYANAGGVIRTSKFMDLSAGRTQITMPFYGVVAEAKSRNEQIISAEINMKILNKAKAYLS